MGGTPPPKQQFSIRSRLGGGGIMCCPSGKRLEISYTGVGRDNGECGERGGQRSRGVEQKHPRRSREKD